jgi:hypothetical protein
MTTFDEARTIAQERVDQLAGRLNMELAINDEATRDEAWCWLFFYNSRAYLETGSFSDALAGNGPILVDKESGDRRELTTARPFDEQLDALKRRPGG